MYFYGSSKISTSIFPFSPTKDISILYNKRVAKIFYVFISETKRTAAHERRLAACNNFHENDIKMLIYNIFINNNTRRTLSIAHFPKFSISQFNIYCVEYLYSVCRFIFITFQRKIYPQKQDKIIIYKYYAKYIISVCIYKISFVFYIQIEQKYKCISCQF